MRNTLRLATLLAFVLAAAASGSRQGYQPPPQPYPQQGYAPPGAGDGEAVHYCTDLDGPSTRGSLCFSDPGRCEDERVAAESDGMQAGPCRTQTPVSCFQRGGDPAPDMEVCAASPEDCDLWRLVDQDHHGRSGPPCEWRHAGPAFPR